MKIIVAPDKFKGSLSAHQAAEAIRRGLIAALPSAAVEMVPMADGGEGTVDAIAAAVGAQKIITVVTGPLGEPVKAEWARFVSPEGVVTAVIEMAAASGLKALREKNRPLEATTAGTGQLIRAALDEGAAKIVIGIGGSATTDGGTGMAYELGARFLDARGRPLAPGGGALSELASIEIDGLDPRLDQVEVLVACDVDNPLCGPAGAAAVYGPQKGAGPAQIDQLEQGLRRLASVLESRLGREVAQKPGAGAAGGLGAGLIVFAGAKLESGVELVANVLGLPQRLEGADLVITGEGQIDRQTIYGKVPAGVARLAGQKNIPVVALAGALGAGAEELYRHGLMAMEPICDGPISLADSLKRAPALLEAAAERLLRAILVGRAVQ
jgi:glycerate 2-kinase